MKTDSTSPDSKAERKVAAARGDEKSNYEVTEFGRRRVSKLPKPLAVLIWLIGSPFVFIYRHLRRSKEG
jgi:hypothetical protein